MALILKSPEFIAASSLGDAVKQTGAIGKIAGFLVIEWNDNTANLQMLAGHPLSFCSLSGFPHVFPLGLPPFFFFFHRMFLRLFFLSPSVTETGSVSRQILHTAVLSVSGKYPLRQVRSARYRIPHLPLHSPDQSVRSFHW